MPTYVYACDSCGTQFERFQSFKDEPLRTCPSCTSAVRRVFQPVGIVFKGSGFYQTDYRSDSYKKGAEKDKPASESKSDSKSESKSESKSTSSSESKSESKSSSSDTGKKESKSAKKK